MNKNLSLCHIRKRRHEIKFSSKGNRIQLCLDSNELGPVAIAAVASNRLDLMLALPETGPLRIRFRATCLRTSRLSHKANISLTHLIISAKATSRHQCERFSTLQGLRTACRSDSALASGELMKSLLDVVDFSPISRVDSNTAKERRLGHCSGLTKHFTWEMSNRDVSQTTHDLFNRLLHTVGSALWIRHKSLKELPNRLTSRLWMSLTTST